MATITYNYEPEQTVWVITSGSCPSAIKKGVVSYIRINVTSVGSPSPSSEILYNILIIGDNGTTEFLELDVFATLADATTEYEIRLT